MVNLRNYEKYSMSYTPKCYISHTQVVTMGVVMVVLLLPMCMFITLYSHFMYKLAKNGQLSNEIIQLFLFKVCSDLASFFASYARLLTSMNHHAFILTLASNHVAFWQDQQCHDLQHLVNGTSVLNFDYRQNSALF